MLRNKTNKPEAVEVGGPLVTSEEGAQTEAPPTSQEVATKSRMRTAATAAPTATKALSKVLTCPTRINDSSNLKMNMLCRVHQVLKRILSEYVGVFEFVLGNSSKEGFSARGAYGYD